jgi:hypothetical protein
MVNTCERLINVVNCNELKTQSKRLEPKRNVVGTRVHFSLVMDINTTGEKSEPNLPIVVYLERGNPIIPPLQRGRGTARQPVGIVGIGTWKKRRPVCNGRDRD